MTTWESSSRLAGTRIIWKLPSIISTPWWPGTRITRRARQWQCFTTPRWPRSTRTRKARAARLSRTGPANVGAPLDENPNIKPSDTRLVLNIAIERLRTDERNRTPKYQGGAGFIRLMRPPQGGSFLDQHEEGKRGNPQKVHQSANEKQGHQYPAAAEAKQTMAHATHNSSPCALAPVVQQER